MTRPHSREVSKGFAVFFVGLCMLIHAAATEGWQAAPTNLTGRLATVEPANRRVTLIPEGEVDLLELFVAEGGVVAQDDRPLTLADLVLRVGRRITVTYRAEGSRRIADRIIVEGEQ